jgi:hypothetical protein
MKPLQLNIVAIFLTLLFFSSCHKRPIDSRNKYIGEWTFNYIRDDWALGRKPMHQLDSGTFKGKIFYHTSPASKGSLEIPYSPNETGHFLVKDDGTLSIASKVGNISKSTLEMNITNANSGVYGMGSGQEYTITAHKTKS